MTKIVDYDHVTGVTETYVKDQMTGEIKVNRTQEVDGLFNVNAEQRSAAGTGWKEEFHKVASIPTVVVEMWREELKAKGYSNPNPLAAENNMWLIAKLNSSDFLKLRTKEGNI